MHTATHHITLDGLTFPHAAPEETWDSNDEPPVLSPSEIIASQTDGIAQYIERKCLSDTLMSAIDALKLPEDRRIIRLSYGLDDGEPKSTEQIAVLIGMSRDNVRQRRSRVLQLLATILSSQKDSLIADARDTPGNTTNLSVSALKTGRTPVGPPLPGTRKK